MFNYILETNFLIQNIQQILDIFLETTVFVVLLLQNIISTKYNN